MSHWPKIPRRSLLGLVLLLLLVGCSLRSPSEREVCLSGALQDLREVRFQIALAQTNLERGYATASPPDHRVCIDLGDNDTDAETCGVVEALSTQSATAVNLVAEREKLLALQQKERELLPKTSRRLLMCDIRIPD